MKEVIVEAVRLMGKGEPCVMATVVRTKGMTPQKPGAKQLFRQDGSSLGTLGGGCVEGDVWHIAQQILRTQGGAQFRDYLLKEDIAIKDGLVCGGAMYFYIEPLWEPQKYLPLAKEIMQACKGGPPIAIATVVSTPPGKHDEETKLLIRENGTFAGSLADKHLQDQVVRTGQKIAVLGSNEFIEAKDGTAVYVEGFTTPPTLVIMGGGHVGMATCQLAKTLGFKVFVVDDRPEYSNKERFPQAEATIVADYSEGLNDLPINFNSFILVATRGHRFDDIATQAAINTPARYVGLLGSKRKNLMIFRDLLNNGTPLERIKEIHAPVGLNIGALTPEELAVSILAEIIMCLRNRDGRPMKMESENLLQLIKRLPKPKKKPLPF